MSIPTVPCPAGRHPSHEPTSGAYTECLAASQRSGRGGSAKGAFPPGFSAVPPSAGGGRCVTCQKPAHDVCGYQDGCPCCEASRMGLEDERAEDGSILIAYRLPLEQVEEALGAAVELYEDGSGADRELTDQQRSAMESARASRRSLTAAAVDEGIGIIDGLSEEEQETALRAGVDMFVSDRNAGDMLSADQTRALKAVLVLMDEESGDGSSQDDES